MSDDQNDKRQLLEELEQARQRIAELEATMREPVGGDRRRHIEDALRIKADRFDLAMSVANDGMFDWDVPTGNIFFDARYYTMAGYDPGEFPGTFEEWVRRVDSEDFKYVEVAVKAYVEGELQEYDQEFRFLRKDGTWMWIRARVKIVEREQTGAARRIIGTHSDVTQRRQAEAEKVTLESRLRQAQKMEAIGRLAGGVAHDFNNVLCAILCSVGLALKKSSDREFTARSLMEISEAAERAAKLTHQLLAFSRQQVIEPRVVDLSALVEKLCPMLVRLIGDDVILRTSPCQDLSRVRVDPGQMEQIVVNLTINARDSMAEGGEVLIETSQVSLDEAYCRTHTGATPGDYVVLSVRDTGAGMDAGTKEKIFEPFFTTKETGKGTGLGLATVFGIVEQHGGRIEVRSAVGQGSCFRLYFPRVAAQVEAVEPPTTHSPSMGRETVLVVEDEAILRTVAVNVLEQLGYKVLSAGSGAEAIELAERYDAEIQLLLTDLVMPHMNGRELAVALTETRPEIKVLYTSGYSHDVIAHRGVLDQGIQFLAKPYSLDSLASRVREMLGHAAAAAGAASPPC